MTLMQRAEKIQVQIIFAADVLHYAGISENAYGSYLLELQQNYPVISAMRVLTKDGLDTKFIQLKTGIERLPESAVLSAI